MQSHRGARLVMYGEDRGVQRGTVASGRSDPAPNLPALRPQLADAWRLLQKGTSAVIRVARSQPDPSLAEVLEAHLGRDARAWPVVGDEWAAYDHVNVQAALDHWLVGPVEVVGMVGVSNFEHRILSLGDLLVGEGPFGGNVSSVAMVDLPSGPGGQVRTCVRCGLWLLDDGGDGGRWAMLAAMAPPQGPGGPKVRVQVLHPDAGRSSAVLADLRRLALEHNVYRGQVVSFGEEMFGHQSSGLTFWERPSLTSQQLILPAGVLDLIDRQVVGVAEWKVALRAAGQHLKRGVLLHGPPGTGKTQTIRYLLGRLEGTTVVVLSGRALSAIGEACSIARALQPAAIVIEDVDLIAEDRGMMPGAHPLLFQLLNEMDGLGEDVDVAFVLTTNRADLLEPALAARPGRVDQAVHIPLPDAAARRALLELYRGGIELRADLDAAVTRTEGVTASFLKELIRRAALVSIEEHDDEPTETAPRIEDRHLDAALDELFDDQNQLTRTIVGGGGGP